MGLFSREGLLGIVLSIPAILIGITIHEYAHAKVADKLGDSTPRAQGRLSLDPFTHIDLFGFVAMLLVGIGWGKPVQVNPYNFKNKYKDDLKVNFAGPLSNLLAALIFGLLYGLVWMVLRRVDASVISTTSINVISIIMYIIRFIVQFNVMLFIFNLLPIPGFDGFHILADLFPRTFLKVSDTLYRYQLFILIALIFPIINGQSIIGVVISPVINYLSNFFITLI